MAKFNPPQQSHFHETLLVNSDNFFSCAESSLLIEKQFEAPFMNGYGQLGKDLCKAEIKRNLGDTLEIVTGEKLNGALDQCG